MWRIALVTSMPYGVAMSCDSTASGVASIDLTGTPFAVAPGDFSLGGNSPDGTTTYGAEGSMVNLTGGGYCGWNSWAPAYNPFNQTGEDPLHWQTTGATSIISPTATGFRVIVRYPGSTLTPSLANQRGWHLNWNRR